MPAAAAPLRLRLAVPVPFRLAAVVRTHGWVELAPEPLPEASPVPPEVMRLLEPAMAEFQ